MPKIFEVYPAEVLPIDTNTACAGAGSFLAYGLVADAAAESMRTFQAILGHEPVHPDEVVRTFDEKELFVAGVAVVRICTQYYHDDRYAGRMPRGRRRRELAQRIIVSTVVDPGIVTNAPDELAQDLFEGVDLPQKPIEEPYADPVLQTVLTHRGGDTLPVALNVRRHDAIVVRDPVL